MKRKQTSEQLGVGRVGGRRGQVVMIFGLLLPVLVAFMGLALDVGFTYHIKRRVQTAADAGAMGGAHEIWRGNSGLVTSAAKSDTKLNGYSDANATVEVNNPPKSGAHTGDTKFVEVIITYEAPTFLMRMFNRDSTTVRGRAVAGLETGSDACVIVLQPTDPATFKVNGTASLNAGCGVMVDSSDSKALQGGGCIQASPAGIGVTGGYTSSCLDITPTTGIPPMMDPLANLPPPPIPASPIATNLKISGGAVTLDPGRYDGGIQITGGAVILNPGTYILNSGLHVSGNTILKGAGVTIYNTNLSGKGNWQDMSISGTVTADLTAPTSGDYKGILFWYDRNAPDKNTLSSIAGGVNTRYEGVFYFPSTALDFKGGSLTTNWTMLIANTLTISGNTLIQNQYGASNVPVPLLKATLVE